MPAMHNPEMQRRTAQALESIIEEAEATRPRYMNMRQAVAILIDDRFERNIIDRAEAEYLHALNTPSWDVNVRAMQKRS